MGMLTALPSIREQRSGYLMLCEAGTCHSTRLELTRYEQGAWAVSLAGHVVYVPPGRSADWLLDTLLTAIAQESQRS